MDNTNCFLENIALSIKKQTGINFFSNNRLNKLYKKIEHLSENKGYQYVEHFIADYYPFSDQLIHSLTFGKSSFYRPPLFPAFQEGVIQNIIEKKNNRQLKIWSAGCSTGEEPYSLAIELNEYFDCNDEWEITIIATDINDYFLEKCKKGIYKEDKIKKIPTKIKSKYFKKTKSLTNNNLFQISPHISKKISFLQHNLIKDPYPYKENNLFDIDFLVCSNVLNYFEINTITTVLKKLSQCLAPGAIACIVLNPKNLVGLDISSFLSNHKIKKVLISNKLFLEKLA